MKKKKFENKIIEKHLLFGKFQIFILENFKKFFNLFWEFQKIGNFQNLKIRKTIKIS